MFIYITKEETRNIDTYIYIYIYIKPRPRGSTGSASRQGPRRTAATWSAMIDTL